MAHVIRNPHHPSRCIELSHCSSHHEPRLRHRRHHHRLTLAELESYGIRHHGLHLLGDGPEARNRCPHPDLDWYQRYLWLKVEICLREKIDVVFEHDKKVIDLFRRFAPKIRVMQVHREVPGS